MNTDEGGPFEADSDVPLTLEYLSERSRVHERLAQAERRAAELEGLLAQAMNLIGMYAFHTPSCVVRAACSCGYTQAYVELQTALAPKEQHAPTP